MQAVGAITDAMTKQSHADSSSHEPAAATCTRKQAIDRIIELVKEGELSYELKGRALRWARLESNAEYLLMLPPDEHAEYLSAPELD